MTLRRFNPVGPGGKLPGAEQTRLADAARAAHLAAGGGDLELSAGDQGVSGLDVRPQPIWARITGGTNPYSWVQVDDADHPLFRDATPYGLSGAVLPGDVAQTAFPAYEINERDDVPEGTKVLLRLSPTLGVWVFQAPGGFITLLCEVTVSGTAHTVKRKTWSAGIVDFAGPVTFTNCRSTTGSNLAVGARVLLDPIPDVSGNYWITPVPAGATYGASTYPFDTNLTSSTPQATQIKVVIPVAGTYLIGYNVRGLGVASTAPGQTIEMFIWNNSTGSLTTPAVNVNALCAQVTGVFLTNYHGGSFIYTSPGSEELEIWAYQGGGGSWGDCRIGANAGIGLYYLKIA